MGPLWHYGPATLLGSSGPCVALWVQTEKIYSILEPEDGHGPKRAQMNPLEWNRMGPAPGPKSMDLTGPKRNESLSSQPARPEASAGSQRSQQASPVARLSHQPCCLVSPTTPSPPENSAQAFWLIRMMDTFSTNMQKTIYMSEHLLRGEKALSSIVDLSW